LKHCVVRGALDGHASDNAVIDEFAEAKGAVEVKGADAVAGAGLGVTPGAVTFGFAFCGFFDDVFFDVFFDDAACAGASLTLTHKLRIRPTPSSKVIVRVHLRLAFIILPAL
jgi:hypothetical protein